MSPVTISKGSAKPRISRAVFLSMKNAVLGRRYRLSIAFVSPDEMRNFNRIYRGTPTSTDILSFPLSKTEGEILFSMPDVERQALFFERKPENFLKFLFIHGLLHLKGYRHGDTMEREESKFRRRFEI